jgi:hypothetical protein
MQIIPGIDNLWLWVANVTALGAVRAPRVILIDAATINAVVDATDSSAVPAAIIIEIVFVMVVRVTHRPSPFGKQKQRQLS